MACWNVRTEDEEDDFCKHWPLDDETEDEEERVDAEEEKRFG